MKIVRIIPNNDELLSVYDTSEGISAFRKIFKLWNDTDYLFKFFQANENDLNITVEDAILKTISDAEKLEEQLHVIAKSSKTQLDSIFKPLHRNDYIRKRFQHSKAYGRIKKSWLRIYAIRINPELYVVTGGAIKLTKTIQERSHTKEQYQILKDVNNHLIKIGFNESDLEQLETEL